MPPESETTLEICLRVNHHLNRAYTVYHGASSAASLYVYFLPVPPLVSSLNRKCLLMLHRVSPSTTELKHMKLPDNEVIT